MDELLAFDFSDDDLVGRKTRKLPDLDACFDARIENPKWYLEPDAGIPTAPGRVLNYRLHYFALQGMHREALNLALDMLHATDNASKGSEGTIELYDAAMQAAVASKHVSDQVATLAKEALAYTATSPGLALSACDCFLLRKDHQAAFEALLTFTSCRYTISGIRHLANIALEWPTVDTNLTALQSAALQRVASALAHADAEQPDLSLLRPLLAPQSMDTLQKLLVKRTAQLKAHNVDDTVAGSEARNL